MAYGFLRYQVRLVISLAQESLSKPNWLPSLLLITALILFVYQELNILHRTIKFKMSQHAATAEEDNVIAPVKCLNARGGVIGESTSSFSP